MDVAVVAMIMVAAVISRPIEVRLWRAGRMSDGLAAMLLVGRFPLIVAAFAIVVGAAAPLVIGLTALASLPAFGTYRCVRELLREEATARRS